MERVAFVGEEELRKLPEINVTSLIISVTNGLSRSCVEIEMPNAYGRYHKIHDCGRRDCPKSRNYQSKPPEMDLPLRPPDDSTDKSKGKTRTTGEGIK